MQKKKTKTEKACKPLTQLRKEIDAIDDEILKLLNRRATLALKVGESKVKSRKSIYAPDRERRIYGRLNKLNKGPLPRQAIRNVFGEIISASRSLEQTLKVAFLGPVATFTHQACMQHFGLSAEFVAKNDISDVFNDVARGKADFGVVPIENSSEGVVSHTLDMFVSSDLKIYAEVLLEVSLALLNKSGRLCDIEKVSSHPNPIAQSRGWLKDNLPGVPVYDISSTAKAASEASKDPKSAAIASVAAANIYDLRVVEEKIEDNINNFTRFLVIGKEDAKKSGMDKTSIMFAIKDISGALYRILQPFAKRGISLTKVESRPVKEKAWEYIFFLDMEGHISDVNLKESIDELSGLCSFVKILGSYPKSHQG
jgi:chorismate mutase/prephenate dehydratase